MAGNIRPIAFYLPQFYPTPENDQWWEPGFTEWTNVVRTKPLFRGHYQPRIPRDLGFYDLRVSETREKQAKLAREAGIEGFCYWHYWFAGRRLLDQVFREVLECKKPDFPFCLCWANHSWKAKTWHPQAPDIMLMEQTYPGEQDYIDHFYAMLPAFKDPRYMKVNGKLIFGIFDPPSFDSSDLFFRTWDRLAKENGLEGFFYFGLLQQEFKSSMFDHSNYDVITYDSVQDAYSSIRIQKLQKRINKFLFEKFQKPITCPYEYYVDFAVEAFKKHSKFVPCIDPDFDHSPRSAHRWVILNDSTPQKWATLCERVTNECCHREGEENLLFIKAWNEWGEGNYLEPDRKWGKQYIEQMAKVFI